MNDSNVNAGIPMFNFSINSMDFNIKQLKNSETKGEEIVEDDVFANHFMKLQGKLDAEAHYYN